MDASRQLLVLSQLDRELDALTRRLNRMAIDDIRAAFNWGARKANAQLGSARLRYDGAGRQVLELAGTRGDGSAFSLVSAPFNGDPNAQAQAIGEQLAAQQTAAPAQQTASATQRQTTDSGGPMSITGSSYLAATARDRIAKAKARIAASQTKLGGALDQLDQSASGMDQIASAIEKEAAELTAAAAAFTNQPPAEEN